MREAKTPFAGGLAILALSMSSVLAHAEGAPRMSPLTLTSSSEHLVSSFNWNKTKALCWVRSGLKPGYIPSYWAGYNYREAFYVRDIAHQCEGAALLGLNEENFSMWRAFAATANESRQWFCLWALDFCGNTYAVDYRSDTNFVREIPAPLELVDRAYTCYLWSGDPRWITDPVLSGFYDSTMNRFIPRHDTNNDGIAEGTAVDIFEGPCGSYCEQSAKGYGVGGDNIATTWSAYQSYARVLEAAGRGSEAGRYLKRAESIKQQYEKDWWNEAGSNYYAGRSIGLGRWITDFDQYSKETYYFQAVKRIAQPGPRANAMLDSIHRHNVENRHKYNFESLTYLPEVFYHYGMNERGWHWLKCLMDSHFNYPEVSFVAIGSIATGMMGIEPEAPRRRLATQGRLTPETGWVQIDHVPIGALDVLVRHENGNLTSTVRNNSVDQDLNWEARIPGSFETLNVDGKPEPASRKSVNGVVVSCVEVTLVAGQRRTVSAR